MTPSPLHRFFVTQIPRSGLRHLIFTFYRSGTIRHTQLLGLPWTSDGPVAETATYKTQIKHNRRTAMPSAGFELATPAIKRVQTYASDRAAAGFGQGFTYLYFY